MWSSESCPSASFTFPMALLFFRELVHSLRAHIRDEDSLSIELERELDDLRKFSLNLLLAFLTIHTISASHTLAVATLALLVYTINLHIVISTRFLQSGPALSRFLHAVPLLGIFCMAVFRLVIILKSPVIAASVLLLCALPPLVITVHLVGRYTGVILIPVPVQMRAGSPAAQGSTQGRVMSN